MFCPHSCYLPAVFRNEQGDGYLGAVSQLIANSFQHGGEGMGTEEKLERQVAQQEKEEGEVGEKSAAAAVKAG